MEREIVLASERYIGKSVFPQELEGTQIGAYLLVTLDGKSEDEVDALIEEAAELVLEAGAMDVLVADTSSKIKDAYGQHVPPSWKPSWKRRSFWMSVT